MEVEESVKEILNANQKYKANNWNGIKENENNYNIIYGESPILLSAPHAVRQYRYGKIKSADTFTGPIVEVLCKRTQANGIIRTFNLSDDPNSENSGYGLKYKNAILEIIKQNNIKCLIDIHGCRKDYGFDIDIGINNGINANGTGKLLSTIKNGISRCGIIEVDRCFQASEDTNICNYIHRKGGIDCFQIEISSAIRKDFDKLLLFLDSFGQAIKELTEEIEKIQILDERD